jgi:4'-phosphopantetheinyl transferase
VIRWNLRAGPPPGGRGGSLPTWLGPSERAHAARLLVPKRRADFLLGRWAAKELLAGLLASPRGGAPPLDSYEIVPGPRGAPVVRRPDGARLPFGVSVSHSDGTAFCAAWPDPDDALAAGADLERIEARSEAFVRDFFTDAETAAWDARPAGGPRDLLATALWSAKEAVLKALRLGLTVDTRHIDCDLFPAPVPSEETLPGPDGDGWKRFRVRVAPGTAPGSSAVAGFWREEEGFVLTLAVRGSA